MSGHRSLVEEPMTNDMVTVCGFPSMRVPKMDLKSSIIENPFEHGRLKGTSILGNLHRCGCLGIPQFGSKMANGPFCVTVQLLKYSFKELCVNLWMGVQSNEISVR